jgi:hypothetical protein
MSPDRPTDPTVMAVTPVSFFAQPARFSSASGEGGLPEFRLREMEGVRTGAGKHAKPSFEHLRRLGEPCAEVLWLPL